MSIPAITTMRFYRPLSHLCRRQSLRARTAEQRVSRSPPALLGIVAACLLMLGRPTFAATTTYTGVYAGGTIAPNDTVVLNNGASIAGNVVTNGTLQFNQSGTNLTVSSTISGTGTLSLTNTGTLNLTGMSGGANAVRLDMNTTTLSGLLQIGSGTADFYIGQSGKGVLSMYGGSVNNASAYLGFNAGSQGNATIGTGLWTSLGQRDANLYIAHSGTGTLDLTGGSVDFDSSYLGYNAGSIGAANVSSGTWNNSGLSILGGGILVVGSRGTGSINMSGGNVTASSGTIGSAAGSLGSVALSSGTIDISGNLTVGDSGTGTLTMTGGVVSVGGSLSQGANGTIALLPGGTLQIGTGGTTGVLLNGTGSITNGGSLVFNRSDSSAFSGAINGNGSVIKRGVGTLTLAGTNTFSGTTNVSEGVLAIPSSTALPGYGTAGRWSVAEGAGLTFGVSDLTNTAADALITSATATGNLKYGAAVGFDVPAGASYTYTNNLAFPSFGKLGFAKSGAGLLQITGSLAYAGPTIIGGGILAIGAGGTTGCIGGDGNVALTSASELWFNRIDDYGGAFRQGISGSSASIRISSGTVTVARAPDAYGSKSTNVRTIIVSGSNGNAGTFNITSGRDGYLDVVSYETSLGDAVGSIGIATVSGGAWYNTLTFQIGRSGSGVLSLNNAHVSVGYGYGLTTSIGFNPGSVGTATLTSSTWSINSDVSVGHSGTGALNISGGLVTGSYAMFIGRNAGGSGSVTMSSGSLVNDKQQISVGYYGAGTLSVSGGSVLSNGLDIGKLPGSVGSVILTGGTINTGASIRLCVGSSGTGTLSVSGGRIASLAGTRLGDNASGVGDASISDGTWLNNGYTMYVGNLGRGTLNVTGGIVSGAPIIVGGSASASGTLTISSGTLSNDGYSLRIGDSGRGLLNVIGGRVNHSAVYLGVRAGSVGTATISGGTVSVGGDFYVGQSGTGSLTIAGGLVTVGGTLSSGTYGIINLREGGTLQIGSGGTSGALGTANFTNNGILIFNRSNDSLFAGAIGGSGSIVKQGAGTLTLSGSSSYTGGTTVSGGTLSMRHAAAIGSTAASLTVNAGTIDTWTYGLSIGALSGSTGALITTSPAAGTRALSTTVASGSSSFAGVIQNNGSGVLAVVKLGAGTLALSGSNSYTGGTTLSDGVLVLASADAIGTSGAISFLGGTLRFTGSNASDYSSRFTSMTGQAFRIDTNSQNVVFASNVQGFDSSFSKLGTGMLTLSGSNSFSGGTTLNAGSLVAGNVNAFGTGAIVLNSGTLDLASRAIANQITNNGGKIMNAANYGGTQSVAGVVSMSGTVGGTVNVAAAGELKGSGVVFNGPVTLASGAQHSPGNSPGTQTFTAGLSYSTGSILNWELIANSGTGAGTNYDFLSVTGGSLSVASGALLNLVFSGSGSTVSWSDPFWNANRSWTIIDALAATSSTGDFTLGTISNDSLGRSLGSVRPDAVFALDQTGNNVVLTFTAVPEPSTYALALMGLGIGVWAMRRRKLPRAA